MGAPAPVPRGAAAGPEVGGGRGGGPVRACRVAAGVEDAGGRPGVDLDDAGLDVGRGHENEHAVDMGEAPEGETLVLDAVLAADDRHAVVRDEAQVVER